MKPSEFPAEISWRPGRNGGRLRSDGSPGNSGGKKGRSGRPSRVWKAFCKATIEDPAVQAGIHRRAKTGDPAIIRVLAEHGAGMPELPIVVTGGSDALEQLLSRLARLAAEETAGSLFPNGRQTSERAAWGLAPLRLSPSSEADDRCDG